MGRPLAAACVLIFALSACTQPRSGSGIGTGQPPPSSAPASSESSAPSTPSTVPPVITTSASPVTDLAHRILAAMNEKQRIGQLFMVGADANSLDQSALATIANYGVGSIFLAGNSSLGVARTASIVAGYQQHAPAAVKLFIATDQEGGTVQRLKGAGFTLIPSALTQGALSPGTLRSAAAGWATQLARAGLNLNLAPVSDTVPSAAFAPNNPPIGALEREYGYTVDVVATHVVAYVSAMLAAGIDTTAKHFPGLGRVTGNTDTDTGVTDNVTTSRDPYLDTFAAAITAATPFVMMSTAIYAKIDPANPAAFSSTVVTGLLRGQLHFRGVVISDDLGAARQVSGYSVANRALKFIAAGGDVVLTVATSQIATMATAVLARANASAAFKAQVDAAALVVLQAKQARGLLH